MASNQDILSFLKAEKDARIKEKEEEIVTRARERQEDMLKISAMIKSGVKDEVLAALQPVNERLLEQEKVTQGLTKKLSSLILEMDVLKAEAKAEQEYPALPSWQGSRLANQTQQCINGIGDNGLGITGGRVGDTRRCSQDRIAINDNVREMCAAGRKVVGFTPIEPRMLQLQIRSYGAKSLEEAMLMEIKSYLKCELKIRPSEIDKFDIVKIFPPAKEDWNVLYVEFGSEYQVDKLFRYTKGMKKDHRIVRWYPKQMYDRYRAVESVAY